MWANTVIGIWDNALKKNNFFRNIEFIFLLEWVVREKNINE